MRGANLPKVKMAVAEAKAKEEKESAVASKPKAEKWRQVKSWSGSGIKKTEPFTITGDKWRVEWSFNATGDFCGICQIMVERPVEDLPEELVANVANEKSGGDVSYVYKSGEFVLNMNCANVRWKVTVEEAI